MANMVTGRVKITVERTGTNFGVVGYVRVRGRIVHSTRTYPLGADAAAYAAATLWVEAEAAP